MPNTGFLRRIAIIIYDLLLLIAILLLSIAIVLPLNGGEAFEKNQSWFPFYLIFICFLYYGWFWTHGGQTLGMKTWKVEIKTFNGQNINWKQAFIRFLAANFSFFFAGLGFIWQIIDKNNCCWHDHLSKTGLYRTLPDPAKPADSEKG